MLQFLLYLVFFLSSVLLIVVVLVQEGKGGGLTDAFGGAGTETFGVRAGNINRFTFGVFAVMILSAMAIHWTAGSPDSGSVLNQGDMAAPPAAGAPIEPGTPPALPPGQ